MFAAIARRLMAPMTTPPRLSLVAPAAPRERHALLLNPFYPKDPRASFGKHVLTPSLALTTLAGATPPSWTVEFWDENLLQGPPPAGRPPAVVGITVHLTFARRAYELARWFRGRGSLVVMGGPHVQACPAEVRPHADALALGNGAHTWPAVLSDVDRGALRARYDAPFDDFAAEPPPRRDILPPWAFLTPLSLTATRGCHNRCDFCYLSTSGLQQRFQARPVEDVCREFERSGAPFGVFVDNNLGSHRGYLRRLCQGLAPLEKIWSAAVSLDVTDDEALVREMAVAGCTGVFVGFESLTDDNLKAAGKRSPRAADYARRVALLQDHGIQVNGSFVLGFDHDGPGCFERTVDWVEEQRLECATYHILTPYPGTPLFARMERAGRILHRDWTLYDTGHCVFRPERMTPEQLEEGYASMYERTFSLASIWRRRPRTPAALAGYMAMSLLYKRSNALWPALIRGRAVHAMWAPLVQASRLRHLRYRRDLGRRLATRAAAPGFALPFRAAP